jgi:hypothetical protein
MKNRFTTNRDDEYEAEIEKLKSDLKKYKDLWSSHEIERVRWEQDTFDDSGLFTLTLVEISNLNNEIQSMRQIIVQLNFDIDELKAKYHPTVTNSEPGPSEEDLQEAMMLLRIKRDTGFNLDYLLNFNSIEKMVHLI